MIDQQSLSGQLRPVECSYQALQSGRSHELRYRETIDVMHVARLDHVQLALPLGGEEHAREFYGEVLGIPEIKKPTNLAQRGGCWFERGDLKIHLGIELDFRPARKAHPALQVVDLPSLIKRLSAHGYVVRDDEPLEGFHRVYVDDPFGNRIELMEPRRR
ncbi:MAG: VOC family protein [Rhodanobacteraceae bacterium]